MLSVHAARTIVLDHSWPLPPATMTLSPALVGQVLAEAIASDLDMPPYDKALMDGYAVRCSDLAQGEATLTVIEEVPAGRLPRKPVSAGQATRIMTGAPLPEGADAVVMQERTTLAGDRVHIRERPPQPGQHILRRGLEMRQGEIVLDTGVVLGPAHLGLLASVGRISAQLHPRPSVSILTTGDEVVEPGIHPGPGQIRNSNGPMLAAQVVQAGGIPRTLGIARDEVEHLRTLLRTGIQTDVLLLSGGVSAGKRDLVPEVLQELGVHPHFHKVEMKPGKPLFFGTLAQTERTTLVFGLPGNPVSSFVCFELFVRPALCRLLGHAEPGPVLIHLALDEDFSHRSDRPTYHPAALVNHEEGLRVRTVPWLGSPDLRGLTRADALVVFPAGEHTFRAGQVVPVLRLDT